MHEWLTYLGYLSPLASVATVLWAGVKAWNTLQTRVERFAEKLDGCSASLGSLSEQIQALAERLARNEERVRGLEMSGARHNRTSYDF